MERLMAGGWEGVGDVACQAPAVCPAALPRGRRTVLWFPVFTYQKYLKGLCRPRSYSPPLIIFSALSNGLGGGMSQRVKALATQL